MSLKFTVNGVEYDQETIEDYRHGRQTKQRKAIIDEWERQYDEYVHSDDYVPEFQNSSVKSDGTVVENVKELDSIADLDKITVEDFINWKYREYWNEANYRINAIVPTDGIAEVVRKIIFSASNIRLSQNHASKVQELAGDVIKYHAHNEESIYGAIKGMGTEFRSQPATLFLRGVGNFGEAPGDLGGAARYLSILGTPLLDYIYKELPYVDMNADDTGLMQPTYVPTPYPIALINFNQSIGTGESTYVAERDADEIIDWVEWLSDHDWKPKPYSGNYELGEVPRPISDTGSEAHFEPSNGYIYYNANVHFKVARDDINKKGKFDVITEFPPGTTPSAFIYNWKKRFKDTKLEKAVIDGRGKGRPTWIAVPTGVINKDGSNWFELGIRKARKEKLLIWDTYEEVMYLGRHEHLAKGWYDTRIKILTRKLKHDIKVLEDRNHRFDLIKEFVEQKMNDWKESEIEAYFTKFAEQNGGYQTQDEIDNGTKLTFEEQGHRDTIYVLGMPVRSLIPESIEKNDDVVKANLKEIRAIKKNLKNIKEFIFSEARRINQIQKDYFAE